MQMLECQQFTTNAFPTHQQSIRLHWAQRASLLHPMRHFKMADMPCKDYTAQLCIQGLDEVQGFVANIKFLQHLPQPSTRYTCVQDGTLPKVNKTTVHLVSFYLLCFCLQKAT